MQHTAQLISAVWTDASITAPSHCGKIPPNDGGMLGECWLHVSSKTTLNSSPMTYKEQEYLWDFLGKSHGNKTQQICD